SDQHTGKGVPLFAQEVTHHDARVVDRLDENTSGRLADATVLEQLILAIPKQERERLAVVRVPHEPRDPPEVVDAAPRGMPGLAHLVVITEKLDTGLWIVEEAQPPDRLEIRAADELAGTVHLPGNHLPCGHAIEHHLKPGNADRVGARSVA